MLKKDSCISLVIDLKFCECGCGEKIPIFDKRGRPRRMKLGHTQKGKNHWNWKNGIIIDSFNYLRKLKPDHPFADREGRVRLHRLVYEEYYNVCLLPWTDIHHINGITTDNRIENLQAMIKKDHYSMHMMGNKRSKIDMSNRTCFDCLLSNTYIIKGKYERWILFQHVFLCSKCFEIRRYKK